MKILIIDDEQGVLKMYSEILRAAGIETLTAPSGQEGMKIAREQQPAIIFLDIIMPRYNGLDVLKDLKNEANLKNTPVYLLTNLPKESSESKAKELGAAGYFVKAEIEPQVLVQKVKEIAKENQIT